MNDKLSPRDIEAAFALIKKSMLTSAEKIEQLTDYIANSLEEIVAAHAAVPPELEALAQEMRGIHAIAQRGQDHLVSNLHYWNEP